MTRWLFATVLVIFSGESAVAEDGQDNAQFNAEAYYDTAGKVMTVLEDIAMDMGMKIIDGLASSGGRVGVPIRLFNPTPIPRIDHLAIQIGGAMGAEIGRGTGGRARVDGFNPKKPDDPGIPLMLY